MWQLNNFLREISGISERVIKDITDFFCWNRGTALANIVWNAFKAFMLGNFISIKAYRDKQRGTA